MADADKDLDINPQAKGGGTDRNIRSVAVTPGQFGIGKIPTTDVTGLVIEYIRKIVSRETGLFLSISIKPNKEPSIILPL